DIAALETSVGLLTRNGARTSHAAVVARQLGKVCLVGCETLSIDMGSRSLQLGALQLREGDTLTLDGNQGLIYQGTIATVKQPDPQVIARLQALREQQSA
ncbi:MAG: pyruvate, phosphate dikinase, partial [Ramlibacter sp.]|nr:pyruvate, phosphate dikinase [Ramlibacter sp.]